MLNTSNNNNNNSASTKNLQISSSTDGGQFVFKSALQPQNRVQLLAQSMSPALGGGTAASTTTVVSGAGGGLVTMTKSGIALTTSTAAGTATGQNIVTNPAPMLPAGVQIVNMRPGAPTIQHATTTTVQQQQQQHQQVQGQQLQGQRTVATVQPRILIGSQNIVTTANNRQGTNSVSYSAICV